MINSNNDSKISNNKFEDTLDADKLVIIINRPWVFDSIVDSLKKI